ncbi:hypothetical protein Rhopal_005015-T1 [Rhodotorula paludigena]|uniref:Uncharacterized protein n=1 Tax=Rhodotorula paludigena TaxID=86838 RepID=A0AAV5GSH7_9BASI|nr:hypothetical protein Rhopal_005015-T1 [Rhodotorula paludigena]
MADPAFRGFVETTLDALLVFEGCKRGFLPKISRRLQEFEKRAQVVSGAVFVFDEEETGIKRWTDGLSWSPSRTLGNFLVYRELDKKAQPPPGGAAEDEDEGGGGGGGGGSVRSRLMGGLTSKADPVDEAQLDASAAVASGSGTRPGSSSARQRSVSDTTSSTQLDRARERALVGSLTSSYRFRADGLVKKTISLHGLHLIGYYRIDDVTSGRLRTPSSHTELSTLTVSSSFLSPTLFRVPPIVEVGQDGQLRYKGEADAPLSPLTRSGSSQGFPTPALNQSRPASSGDAIPPFGSVLPTPGGMWDHSTVPSSPRRGATATLRSTNRYDPYGSTTRYSPSTAPGSHNASAYPFPAVPSASTPIRASFPPIGESAYEVGLDGMFQARTPPVDALSSSAPVMGGWPGAGNGGPGPSVLQQPPQSRNVEYGLEPLHAPSSSFYQPRHSIPYAPTTDSGPSNAIFAYNPPPDPGPGQGPPVAQYRAPQTASGALQYQSYHIQPSYPLQHPHAACPPQSYGAQLSPTSENPHSPFATPPSTSHAARSGWPSVAGLAPPAPPSGSQLNSGHSSPAPPPLGYAFRSGPIVEPTNSLAQQAASVMAEISPHSPADALGPSRMQHQQQEALNALYGYPQPSPHPPPQQVPSPYESTPQAYAHPTPPQGSVYGYGGPHQPSGLVGALGTEDVVPASGHGLGVSAYGEIVPANQVSSAAASTPGGYPGLGLRQAPPPPQASVALSSSHGYAPPSQTHTPQPNHHGYNGGDASHQLMGALERDAAHSHKFQSPDLHHPLSPPLHTYQLPPTSQPPAAHSLSPHLQQMPHLPPPPPPLQQPHSQTPQWWDQSANMLHAKAEYP